MKHSWGIIGLLLLTGCAAPATPAVPSTADVDQIYLTQYRQRFPGGTDEAGIRIGHSVCDAYKAGTTFAGEVAYIQSQNAEISAGDAGYLIGASTAAYCPEYNNRH
jgi:hypothetical protein